MFRVIRAWFFPAKPDVIVREEVEKDERGYDKPEEIDVEPQREVAGVSRRSG